MDNFYTQSFQDFASSAKPLDLALYAGVGLIIWVFFKDKLNPIQKILSDLITKVKSVVKKPENTTINTSTTNIQPVVDQAEPTKEDVFFKLVVSWKQTRDLAVQTGCVEAVKVADQMFPFLSPNVCEKDKV